MLQLAKRFPFLAWALGCLVFLLVVRLFEALGGGYDDGRLGSISFALSLIWAWLAFPYHLISEYLFTVNYGASRVGHLLITLVGGTAVLAAAEVLNQLFRSARARRNAG